MFILEKTRKCLSARMPGGGYLYERLKYLKRLEKDALMTSYEEYCKKVYFFGAKHIVKSSFFMGSEYVLIEDLKMPNVTGHDIHTFWCEFPDCVLPYILEKRGMKYNFSKIEKLMVEGPYELNNHIEIKENDVVVDCGANMGLFSAIAAKKGGLVYAFEPDDQIIERYLKKTQKWNQNISIQKYALSSNCGSAMFGRTKNSIGVGSLLNSNTKDSFEVETITLDKFAADNNIKKIDFIKADIEGAERDLLYGAKEVLRTMHPKLAICTYHLLDDPEVLEKIVLDANPNYVIEHKYKKMYAYVPDNI